MKFLLSLFKYATTVRRGLRGASGVEYGLLAGLIAIAIMASVGSAGKGVSALFCVMSNRLGNVVGVSTGGGCGGTVASGPTGPVTCASSTTAGTQCILNTQTVMAVGAGSGLYIWPSDESGLLAYNASECSTNHPSSGGNSWAVPSLTQMETMSSDNQASESYATAWYWTSTLYGSNEEDCVHLGYTWASNWDHPTVTNNYGVRCITTGP